MGTSKSPNPTPFCVIWVVNSGWMVKAKKIKSAWTWCAIKPWTFETDLWGFATIPSLTTSKTITSRIWKPLWRHFPILLENANISPQIIWPTQIFTCMKCSIPTRNWLRSWWPNFPICALSSKGWKDCRKWRIFCVLKGVLDLWTTRWPNLDTLKSKLAFFMK